MSKHAVGEIYLALTGHSRNLARKSRRRRGLGVGQGAVHVPVSVEGTGGGALLQLHELHDDVAVAREDGLRERVAGARRRGVFPRARQYVLQAALDVAQVDAAEVALVQVQDVDAADALGRGLDELGCAGGDDVDDETVGLGVHHDAGLPCGGRLPAIGSLVMGR